MSVVLFVGGGQAYYGPTAQRDKLVVLSLARMLARSGAISRVITGGTEGVPDDFAHAFLASGGSEVLEIIPEVYLGTYKKRLTKGRKYVVEGKTMDERRMRIFERTDVNICLFVQGGQFTTHEMLLAQEKGLRTVSFVGSGGASGGQIKFNGKAVLVDTKGLASSTDPLEDPHNIAKELLSAILGKAE
jgi:hypothetical protein